jgi:hypothetical protein
MLPCARCFPGLYLLLAVFAAAMSAASAVGAAYRVVATTEMALPGLPGTNFSGFDPPVINDLGRVAFRGLYSGGEGIFSDAVGSLAAEARTGTTVPTLAASFSSFAESGPLLNNQGNVAFFGSYDADYGLFRSTAGSLETIARTGMTAPGSTSPFFLLRDLALNADGDMSFTGFTGSSTAQIYTNASSALARFAGSGTAVPSNGFTSSSLANAHSSVLSDDGRIAFIGNNGGANVGIFVGDAGSSAKDDVVLWTDPTGMGTGLAFNQPNFRPTINAAGRVAFLISHTNPTSGVWYSDGGAPQPVALMSQTDVPDGSPGEKISSLSPPALNEAGVIAFRGGTTTGIEVFRFGYLGTDVLERLAPAGQVAPGAGGDRFTISSGLLLSDSGQVAFASLLQSGRRGLWAFGDDDRLRLVALERSAFDHDGLPSTPDRIIEAVSLITDSQARRSSSDGTGTAFNANNQLAFSLKFTAASGGGGGVYVADVDAIQVPEPTSTTLALCAAAVLWRRRSR